MKQLLLILMFVALFGVTTFGQKFNLLDENRVYWGDDEKLHDEILIDGTTYRTIKQNGIFLAVSGIRDGNYYAMRVFVGNNTDQRFDVKPTDAYFQIWKKMQNFSDAKPSDIVAFPIAAESIANKIRNRAAWANVFSSLGASFSTQTATIKNNQTGETATVTIPNTDAQNQTRRQNTVNSINAGNSAAEIIRLSLKGNTVFPNDSTMGNIYFKAKKHEMSIFVIKINGIEYGFPYGDERK